MAEKPYPDNAFNNLRKGFPDNKRDAVREIVWDVEGFESLLGKLGYFVYYDSLTNWEEGYGNEPPRLVSNKKLWLDQFKAGGSISRRWPRLGGCSCRRW